jgi:glycosyltransferase involved in cell wall biosynthesis
MRQEALAGVSTVPTAPRAAGGPAPGSSPPRICFVAHNALGALTGRGQSHAGGIERQQALMAKWLARHGHRVAMVTWDEGETAAAHEGVELLPLCRREAGLRGLRFFVPRWSSLNRALERAAADIYYYNCGDLGLGQVTMWTKRRGKSCVFSVASDADVDRALPNLRSARDRWLYRWGLQRCDAIIVQTETQRRALQSAFGRDATVLPMPCEGVPNVAGRRESGRARVLWVGRLSAEKRPHWLLDIAAKLPHLEFELVGAANVDTDYARSVADSARRTGNVTLTGRVPYEHMEECYRRASILCSTSMFEGFPNIFLEAWSAGIPVVATCDPDGLIASRQLGLVGHTVEELAAAIDALARSAPLRESVGRRARDYFLERHVVDRAMQGFAATFAAACSR